MKREATAIPRLSDSLVRYRNDPVAFARDVLHQHWTTRQEEIAQSLLQPPYRTLVKSGHNLGKSMLAAGVALWWHLTRRPSIVITTAPKFDQVKKILWKEVRVQAVSIDQPGVKVHFAGPAAPYIEVAPDDFMLGTTAKSSTAFQGHHAKSMLFIFDEAVGVEPEYWEVTKTMFKPELGHAWLCIFNPTDTTQQAYLEEMAQDEQGEPSWNVITMSALDHPNIQAGLRGARPPIPAALSLAQLEAGLREDCTPVAGERRSTDIEWPPASGRWLRPGPIAESRWLGRWPSQGTYGVWGDADWQAVTDPRRRLEEPVDEPYEIGCDVARFGDDWTEIHVRRGPVSVHHEAANGWSTAETAGRLKELAREYAALFRAEHPGITYRAEDLAIKIDDDGVGGGVVDQAGDFNFVPVSAASAATDPNAYPNRRSELWFATALRARMGLMDLSRLPRNVLHKLKQQAMAPTWKLDAAGRRVVEPKEDTKEKLKRSPDGMDGLNLAYLPQDPGKMTGIEPARKSSPRELPPRGRREERPSAAQRRRLYGV